MSQRLSITTTPERSRLMAKVRQTGTTPELVVQNMISSLGHRFSVKASDLPGSPDIINRASRWAIFVHGCFWHAHSCYLWKVPKTNRKFWKKKFENNQRRDKAKRRQLRSLGYSVLTLWQCELKDETKARNKILQFLMKANAANGHVLAVADLDPQPIEVAATYQFNEKENHVSRHITRRDGRQFETRRDLVPGISTKQDARSMFDQVFLRSTKLAWHSPLRGAVRTADLFSGCGGLSLGVCEASIALGKQFESVLAVDNDASSLEVYKRNFNPAVSIDRDIRSVLSGKIGDRLRSEEKSLLKRIGPIDICLAGSPCQGHSDLNNHTRRKDSRNELYGLIARFAEIAGPTHIIAENVPTLIHGQDRTLDSTIARLEQLGYAVDIATVNLADLGVPQRRKRHVMIASNRSVSIDEIIKRHKVLKERTLRWAIADLARRAPASLLDTRSKLHPDNIRRIEYLMKHDEYDLPNNLRPICHQDAHSYVSMYGRLRYDQPAQTITSGFGSPGQGRYIHPSCRRTLTPHEAVRLQCFPDSFDFSSVKRRTSLANMIGNAVPMQLAYVFCLELIVNAHFN
jgi:DNA (cytosine-5)-methyltransferase 1